MMIGVDFNKCIYNYTYDSVTGNDTVIDNTEL